MVHQFKRVETPEHELLKRLETKDCRDAIVVLLVDILADLGYEEFANRAWYKYDTSD